MEKIKITGDEPVFAAVAYDIFGRYCQEGLSKREYFAAMAMQGICTSEHYNSIHYDKAAVMSVNQADALIVELNK